MTHTAPAKNNILEHLDPFQACFTKPTWKRIKILVKGAVLAAGARTVTACLRSAGRAGETSWSAYHRVLNTAPWKTLQASRILLSMLIRTFCPEGRIVFTLDDTLERRNGRKISIAGWFRDPVRSTEGNAVTVRGIRWLVLALCVRPWWSGRHWSLPVLSVPVPAPLERERRGSKKCLTDYSRQLICLLRRWLPEREIVLLADGAFAVHELYRKASMLGVTVVTRCRQDLMIHEPLVVPVKRRRGRPWTHGSRLPKLSAVAASPATRWVRLRNTGAEVAFQDGLWHRGGTRKPPVPVRLVLERSGSRSVRSISASNQLLTPEEIVDLYDRRWSIEVTFQEARAHMGVEQGRGWSPKTVARTTPSLFAFFSLVVLLANGLAGTAALPLQRSAWYEKTSPAFIDLLAGVRRSIWMGSIYRTAQSAPGIRQISTPLARWLLEAACYAA